MSQILLNKALMIKMIPMVKILLITTLVSALLQVPNISAQEKKLDSNKPELNKSGSTSSGNKTSKIKWPIDQLLQSKNHHASESFWIEVAKEKILILKYRARGRIFRGNAVLLHAQGENADHPRVIQSFAKQLSDLGWQVFVPNLPQEDLPELNNSSKDINKPAPIKAKSNTSFKNTSAYQQHINQTIKNLITKIQPKSKHLILIGNKNSAYWLLESAKTLSDIKQIVLLDPQTPKTVKINLKNSFDGQFLPVYTFIKNNQSSQNFLEGFERQLWKSKFQRLNRNMMNHHSILLEDNRIAKSITGWIKNQEKK